jgi:hypothetical protein
MTDQKKNLGDILGEWLANPPPSAPGRIPVQLHPRLIKALTAAINAPTVLEPKRPVGAPRKGAEAWRIFVCVVHAKRKLQQAAPLTTNEPRASVVTRPALSDAVEAGEGPRLKYTPESFERALKRYEQTYRRKLREGWKDDDVPPGSALAAMYGANPER